VGKLHIFLAQISYSKYAPKIGIIEASEHRGAISKNQKFWEIAFKRFSTLPTLFMHAYNLVIGKKIIPPSSS